MWEFQHKQADEIYIFLLIDRNDEDKKVFFCFSFRCEENTVECFSMQTEKLARSLRVKILWSTGVFFCFFI